MFVFPAFSKTFVKYGLSKQTDANLGEVGVADLLGTRDDNDREHMRLYRAVTRRLRRDGLSGLSSDKALAAEVRRYHEKNSQNPTAYRKMRERIDAASEQGLIASYVQPLLCDPVEDGKSCQDCVRILCEVKNAENVALKVRSGLALTDGFSGVPWSVLGARAVSKFDEAESSGIERLVSCDVVLFLWIVALLGGHGAWKRVNIEHYLPTSAEKLGEAWFRELERFALSVDRKSVSQNVGSARYKTVAAFLVSGDPDDGPMETLAEELSAIVRGKKRLTARIVKRHAQLLVEAIKAYWDDQPEKMELAENIGLIVGVVGTVIGVLQFSREVALSDIRSKYPSADIDSAFDVGLACWPKVVELARE